MIKYYKEVVDRDLVPALAGRICGEAASDFLGKGFCDTGYFTYFTLCSAFDRKITLRFALVCPGKRKAVVEKVTGRDVRNVIEHPKTIDRIAARNKAKRVIVSLSAPDGYDIREAYEAADRIFESMKSAELYDFVFIDRGEAFSLIRSLMEK